MEQPKPQNSQLNLGQEQERIWNELKATASRITELLGQFEHIVSLGNRQQMQPPVAPPKPKEELKKEEPKKKEEVKK